MCNLNNNNAIIIEEDDHFASTNNTSLHKSRQLYSSSVNRRSSSFNSNTCVDLNEAKLLDKAPENFRDDVTNDPRMVQTRNVNTAHYKPGSSFTDSALSFSTFQASSSSSNSSSAHSSPKYTTAIQQGSISLLPSYNRPVSSAGEYHQHNQSQPWRALSASACTSPAPSIIRVVNNSHTELNEHFNEKNRSLRGNQQLQQMLKKRAVDVISEEVKLEKSQVLKTAKLKSASTVMNTYYSSMATYSENLSEANKLKNEHQQSSNLR